MLLGPTIDVDVIYPILLLLLVPALYGYYWPLLSTDCSFYSTLCKHSLDWAGGKKNAEEPTYLPTIGPTIDIDVIYPILLLLLVSVLYGYCWPLLSTDGPFYSKLRKHSLDWAGVLQEERGGTLIRPEPSRQIPELKM